MYRISFPIEANKMTDKILSEIKDGILRIELNRPEKKNALSNEMRVEIAKLINQGEKDPSVRVILMHGQEDFCAGADVGGFSEAQKRKVPVQEPNVIRDAEAPHIKALRTATKPLIAAVKGYAIGVGTTILFHFDLIYAGVNTKFRLPFVNLGLCPENGSAEILPKLAGLYRAAELFYFGDFFSAEEAHRCGFVNKIFPDDEVLSRSLQLAAKLAAKPPGALITTKAMIKRASIEQIKNAINYENILFGKLLQSPESKEAISAFMEKRKPDFSKIS